MKMREVDIGGITVGRKQKGFSLFLSDHLLFTGSFDKAVIINILQKNDFEGLLIPRSYT